MTETKRKDGCTHRQDPSDTDLPGCWFVCRFDRREWSPWTQSRTSLHPSCPLWGTSGHWLSGWPWKEAWWNWCTCWGRSCLVVLHKGQHCCLLESALSTQPCHWPWSRYRWPGYWLCSPPVPACCPCHTVKRHGWNTVIEGLRSKLHRALSVVKDSWGVTAGLL